MELPSTFEMQALETVGRWMAGIEIAKIPGSPPNQLNAGDISLLVLGYIASQVPLKGPKHETASYGRRYI